MLVFLVNGRLPFDVMNKKVVHIIKDLEVGKNNFIGAIGISETAKNLYSKLKWKIGKLSHMFV